MLRTHKRGTTISLSTLLQELQVNSQPLIQLLELSRMILSRSREKYKSFSGSKPSTKMTIIPPINTLKSGKMMWLTKVASATLKTAQAFKTHLCGLARPRLSTTQQSTSDNTWCLVANLRCGTTGRLRIWKKWDLSLFKTQLHSWTLKDGSTWSTWMTDTCTLECNKITKRDLQSWVPKSVTWE